MKVYNIVLVVIYMDYVSSDVSNETSSVENVKLLEPLDDDGPMYRNLWEHKPRDQPQNSDEYQGTVKLMTMREPRVLTRLAKSLVFRYDPFFARDIFGPFERRPRPITLVAIRKHGIPRKQVKLPEQDGQIAELQSPYNDKNDALLLEN